MNDANPSKSARKRDHLALQALGEKLIPLDVGELRNLPLDEPLFEAIVQAKQIRSRGALRRQRQLIGKLMREADAESIRASLERLGRQDRLARDRFREAESWRDRITAEGAPAMALFSERAGSPQPELEKLLREFEAAKSEPAKRSISRRMFRHVFDVLADATQPGDR